MRVIIAGSRTIRDFSLICRAVEQFGPDRITQVVSGKQRSKDKQTGEYYGADYLGERWAHEHNIPVRQFQAFWDAYGYSAGPRRNRQMADYADAAIVVWDGQSRGSSNMINEMRKVGKECLVFKVDCTDGKKDDA
jgi:hypothetical protein